MTIDVPDALAAELKAVQDQMGRIIELGLERFRDVDQDASRFASMSEVVDVLAQLPEPEEILALRPSKALQERISALIEKSRSTGLSEEEQAEWDRYERLEHVVRIAKARAAKKLSSRA